MHKFICWLDAWDEDDTQEITAFDVEDAAIDLCAYADSGGEWAGEEYPDRIMVLVRDETGALYEVVVRTEYEVSFHSMSKRPVP